MQPILSIRSARFFGLSISLLDKRALTELICGCATNGRRLVAIGVNAQYINEAAINDEFRNVLKAADVLYIDGAGILWALRALGNAASERATTTDLLPLICSAASAHGLRLYFLGGRPTIAEQAVENLKKSFTGLTVAGTAHGYFNPEAETRIIHDINSSHPHILFVGMGVPKEQLWVARNKHLIEAQVIMTCGGMFDYYSGKVKRAPMWMQRDGLEWFYRLLHDPKQYGKRYLMGNPLYIYRTVFHLLRNGRATRC
jgi:N-acetylglucosaminyldiphosphoundecaprenol N-acetyl-beta-D-mannosaminyltransferase